MLITKYNSTDGQGLGPLCLYIKKILTFSTIDKYIHSMNLKCVQTETILLWSCQNITIKSSLETQRENFYNPCMVCGNHTQLDIKVKTPFPSLNIYRHTGHGVKGQD